MKIFSSSDLNFSEEAIAHFASSLENRGKGEGIKIGVRKAGCSGYEYYFDYVDSFDSNGVIFDKNGCKIFVDNESLNFLKGSLVDYEKDGLNQGIKFINPNAKAVCGCGESFTIQPMSKIKILPHEELCPEGIIIENLPHETICEAALRNGVNIEHACEMSAACTTCHVVVRKGFESLDEASDIEEDLLDKAWGLEQTSRLSCQAVPKDKDIEIEVPKYNINMVSENH